MLYVGYLCSKKNRNTDDFYLGGRKLGPLVTAMSAEASDMSSWLLMGLPGVAYLTGIADAGWTAIGLALGTYVNWLIVARRIRCYTHLTGSITLPNFFSRRYYDDRNILCGISAIVILIFFIPYTASGFAACGKLFSSLFGVDYMTAMLISAAVIVLYCTMGGFLAASTTDFIQSIIMTIALLAILLFGIHVAGGWSNVVDNAESLAGYLQAEHHHDHQSDRHNNRLHQVCDTGRHEAAQGGIKRNDCGADHHSCQIIHAENGGKQLAAGRKPGRSIWNEEYNNDNRRNAHQRPFFLVEPIREKLRDGDCVSGNHRIAP